MQEKKILPRLVIWGLKNVYHTHRHIHKAFYDNAKKLGYNVLWVEDRIENQKYILPGDVIIAAEVHGKMVPEKTLLTDYYLPIRDDVKYCLHNYKNIFTDKLSPQQYINLQVYTNKAEESDIKIDTARYFDTKTRTLYQPWGTDLLFEEFKKPVYNHNKFVFWIGSIWNNKANQGNIDVIAELKATLVKHKLRFTRLRFIPDMLNIFFTRLSRLSPAIGGKYQVDVNYLPCRVFKNISYGQLGVTNIQKFQDILKETFISKGSIEELITTSLSISPSDYKTITKKQQEYIQKYTYKESLEYIYTFLDIKIN